MATYEINTYSTLWIIFAENMVDACRKGRQLAGKEELLRVEKRYYRKNDDVCTIRQNRFQGDNYE